MNAVKAEPNEPEDRTLPTGWPALGVLALVYVAVTGLGLSSLLQSATVAPVVPAAGLAMAVHLLTPRGARLRVLAVLFVSGFIGVRLFGRSSAVAHFFVSGIELLAYFTAALIAQWLGGRHMGRLGRLRDVGSLLVGAFVGTALWSIPGAITLVVMGNESFTTAFAQWWIPDLVACTTITPALLVAWHALRGPRQTISVARLAEAAVLLGLMAAGSWYAHVGWRVLNTLHPPVSVIVLPLLGWGALRFGALGTTWGTLLMGAMSVVATLNGQSAFSGLSADPFIQLMWTQVFVVTVSISMLALAAALAERQASVAGKALALVDAQRSADRFRAFFEGTSEMIAVVDREERLVMYTSAWAKNQERCYAAVPPLGAVLTHDRGDAGTGIANAWRDAVRGRRVMLEDSRPVQGGDVAEFEHLFVPLRDGAGEVIGATESVRDVAELRDRQDAVARTQRLESIGRLAGGVAHDFNNILSVILGYTSLLESSLSPDDPNRADVQEIAHAGRRASRLTDQLLTYARRQIIEPRVVDLAALLGELNPMLERLLGENIELRWAIRDGTGMVVADPGQLEQVVVNLAINARDAMPAGGRLAIETALVALGSDAAVSRDLTPGDYVLISVSDTGTGMSPEVQSRIFEPFFSTKSPGHGTGLGLATVEGIVHQIGGAIAVDSEPGRGTTFKVFIPRSTAMVADAAHVQAVSTSLRGTERILLVEDDDVLRTLSTRILTEHGYDVIALPSAEAVLALPDASLRACNIMVSDVVLAGMTGPGLAAQLAVRFPSLQVLFVSGYAETALAQQGLNPEGTHFLAKPFAPDVLLGKVRALLDVPEGPEFVAPRHPP